MKTLFVWFFFFFVKPMHILTQVWQPAKIIPWDNGKGKKNYCNIADCKKKWYWIFFAAINFTQSLKFFLEVDKTYFSIFFERRWESNFQILGKKIAPNWILIVTEVIEVLSRNGLCLKIFWYLPRSNF